MRKISLVLFFLMFSFASSAEDVGLLHLNPLHLELPATWSFDGSKNPIEGKGPEGEKLLISVMGAKNQNNIEIAQGFATNEMRLLAAKNGNKVIKPVSSIPMADGKVGFSSVSEKTGFFSRGGYFIQYLLASSTAVIYFTVEGLGSAEKTAERFDAIMVSQKWDE